jgi:hypothetical protein
MEATSRPTEAGEEPYLSALIAIRCDPAAKTYYQRKRAEGKRPIQAVICLARRRTNVLWALMRDHRTWQPEPPVKPTTSPRRLDNIN